MTTSQTRLDIGRLAFRVLASPGPSGSERPPFVLVHGIGMSHRYLSKLHDLLAAEGPVYSIDLPGFGGLPKPGHDVDVFQMATALGEVIASLDVVPVVLVGQSMGCQWVVEAGAQRPDLVSHVVAIGPVVDESHRTAVAQTVALAIDSLGEPPNVNALVLTDYIRCGVPWYLAQLRHMLAYPIEDRVTALTMPLLLVRGGRDPIAGQEWCRRLRDRASSARLVVIPGHFHNAQQSAPRAMASAIEAHTLEVSARS
ncbi:alpha/beta hydrolase [Microbacterium sp. 4R-513]|uniref:alpha/beta fold hydrolase n=1 Tax=Microbacterium sp. 4R-513 TaxID=2567934 RepID=UPI0013E17EAB|nr:alpha/beta hydrolase [Microbacterium sp. 4R-513]QIG38725.1 alpha/beta hydrolase [Microbacterium sp. 4R-513]